MKLEAYLYCLIQENNLYVNKAGMYESVHKGQVFWIFMLFWDGEQFSLKFEGETLG
jgi:hypothetical protein